jgi:hypothetical protein
LRFQFKGFHVFLIAMKKAVLLILISLFLQSNAYAARTDEAHSWQELGIEDVVTLTQRISLLERGGSANLELKKGAAFELFEITALPGLTLALLQFRPEICDAPRFISELELVLPEGASSRGPHGEEVGVSFGPNCILEVYVEAKDMGRPSFFNVTEGALR